MAQPTTKTMTERATTEAIASCIVVLRGRRVILDADLARLYGVATKRFNEQVRRNAVRFPADFMFRLTFQEVAILRSQIATSNEKPRRGGRRNLPWAFTEHGALMAANVLNSTRAVEIAIFVVRAFVELRESFAAHKNLAARLDELETRLEKKLTAQDQTIRAILEAIRQLMAEPEPRRRPIGFVNPDDDNSG